jgi:hypothetical protein
VHVLGTRAAADYLAGELAPLLDLDRDRLMRLVEPMFSHLVIENARLRVTVTLFEQLGEAGLLAMHGIRGTSLASSYAALVAHRDPTVDDILAAALADDPRVDPEEYRMTIRFDD